MWGWFNSSLTLAGKIKFVVVWALCVKTEEVL